eukprot:scaffold8630_cov115-Isochrysis_galbana.AAC.4
MAGRARLGPPPPPLTRIGSSPRWPPASCRRPQPPRPPRRTTPPAARWPARRLAHVRAPAAPLSSRTRPPRRPTSCAGAAGRANGRWCPAAGEVWGNTGASRLARGTGGAADRHLSGVAKDKSWALSFAGDKSPPGPPPLTVCAWGVAKDMGRGEGHGAWRRTWGVAKDMGRGEGHGAWRRTWGVANDMGRGEGHGAWRRTRGVCGAQRVRGEAPTPAPHTCASHRATSGDPEQQALHSAYATSLRTSNSSDATISSSRGIRPAPHTAATCVGAGRIGAGKGVAVAAERAPTCAWSPAVKFETIHAVSLRISFFGLRSSSPRQPSTPHRTTAPASAAVPAAMLPTVRSAGVCTAGWLWLSSRMSGFTAPASTTGATRSGGSDRYDSAQQTSVSTSSSVRTCSNWTSTGRAGAMSAHRGGGLPRHKLDRSHVALRCMAGKVRCGACDCDEPATRPKREGAATASAAAASCADSSTKASHCAISGAISPYESTRSRQRGESPARFPSAQSDCSRTTVSG